MKIIGDNTQATDNDLVKDGSAATFNTDIINPSARAPVIVYFWVPQDKSCKELSTLLQSLIRQSGGGLSMVRINVNNSPELAAQLRVSSVPAVYAFSKGQPIDGFVGFQDENQIREFLKRISADNNAPLAMALQQAQNAMNAGDLDGARSIFANVLGEDPDNLTATAGILRCAIATNDLSAARQMAEALPDKIKDKPEIKAAISALELAEQGNTDTDTDKLRQKLANNKNDHQSRYDLAIALYGDNQGEAAIDELLELVRRDNKWNNEAARKRLLKIFDALGPADPLTSLGRRQLSTILFS